jgi:hypothetical protein
MINSGTTVTFAGPKNADRSDWRSPLRSVGIEVRVLTQKQQYVAWVSTTLHRIPARMLTLRLRPNHLCRGSIQTFS